MPNLNHHVHPKGCLVIVSQVAKICGRLPCFAILNLAQWLHSSRQPKIVSRRVSVTLNHHVHRINNAHRRYIEQAFVFNPPSLHLMSFNFAQSFMDAEWQLYTEAMPQEPTQPDTPTSPSAQQLEWSFADFVTGQDKLSVRCLSTLLLNLQLTIKYSLLIWHPAPMKPQLKT